MLSEKKMSEGIRKRYSTFQNKNDELPMSGIPKIGCHDPV
jgi:hypothetical protein